MKNFLRLSVATVFAVTAVFVGVSVAQEESTGQGGTGFRISPARDDVAIEQGSAVTRTISVRNVTSFPVSARAVIDDFGPSDDESGTPSLLVGDQQVENYPYSIKPFVASISDINLAPGEEADVNVRFSIPTDAAPGSYYGVVRFVSLNDLGDVSDGSAAVGLNASVGTIYLIDVPGETIDSLKLEQVGATKDGEFGRLFSSAPDKLVFRIRNDGNTFQAPFGDVRVKDWGGNVVQEYELNDGTPPANVLPGSIRRFERDLENIGSFGRYEVTSNISYGSGGNVITSTVTFWVVPWAQVGIGLVILIAVGLGSVKGIRSYNRSIIEKSKGTRVKKK